ncbi:flavodoxin [Alterileibacterium massiliense]|uniref:flavodoxin n=1 Tax=Alterileibacterium massiliense TaxID=1870997 RepID=UPI0008DA32BA|nr:flavodoxin [Alterileibacterium massiliense]
MSKVAVVYWSATGNTEAMANAIKDGAKENGAEVTIFDASDFNSEMIKDYDSIAFGCPAMGSEQLEEEIFEPLFEDCETKLDGKKVVIFGSYDWGDGEWMREWEKRCIDHNIDLVSPPLMLHLTPDSEGISDCKIAGGTLA